MLRGANDKYKTKTVNVIIKANNADIVCIQEIEIQYMSDEVMQDLGVRETKLCSAQFRDEVLSWLAYPKDYFR